MAGNWWEDDYTPPPFDVGTTPGVGYNDLFGPGTQPGLGPGYGNDDYFNPYAGDYPPSYFPPADTGTIIGNTPGTGPLPDNPFTFRGTPTYGNQNQPYPPDSFPPRDTGDIIRGTPGVSGRDLGNAPFNWGKLWNRIRPFIGGAPPGQGPPGGGTLPAIARILQGLSKGRAEGRISEAEMARLYDYLNLARTRTFYDRAGQELDQRKFGQDLQERSYRNAIRSSFLQNYTAPPGSAPAEIAPFVGPRAPGLEAIPQGTRNEIGGAMYRNAITELLDPLQPGTATTGRRMAALPEPEAISPTPEAGRFDDVLNWASIIMGGLYPTPPTPTTPPQTPTKKPPEQPPAAIDPRRSMMGSTGTPGMQISGQPFRELPRATSPSLQSLSTPTTSAIYTPPPSGPTTSPSGPASLPQIANLVPEVPRPTAPLGSGRMSIAGQPFRNLPPVEYDEYGRPIRGGR